MCQTESLPFEAAVSACPVTRFGAVRRPCQAAPPRIIPAHPARILQSCMIVSKLQGLSRVYQTVEPAARTGRKKSAADA